MQKHYNYLDIDLDSKNYRKLRAMQGDTKSRYILVNLYSNNLAYDLSHCTVKIYGLKRDKTIFFNNAVVKNAKLGQFEIELTNQALAVPGELKVQILVLGTDGEKLTSSAFFIDVGESIIDENAIESTNEFGALTESLTKVEEWNGYFEETSGKIEEKYTERLNNVNSQLEHKVNKNHVWNMSNMGQDVKEAMTGGSVAVVGKNTILTDNIVDRQVTMEKTSFIDVTRFDDLLPTDRVLQEGISWNSVGWWEDSPNYFVMKTPISVVPGVDYSIFSNFERVNIARIMFKSTTNVDGGSEGYIGSKTNVDSHITVPEGATYMFIQFYNGQEGGLSKQEFLNSLKMVKSREVPIYKEPTMDGIKIPYIDKKMEEIEQNILNVGLINIFPQKIEILENTQLNGYGWYEDFQGRFTIKTPIAVTEGETYSFALDDFPIKPVYVSTKKNDSLVDYDHSNLIQRLLYPDKIKIESNAKYMFLTFDNSFRNDVMRFVITKNCSSVSKVSNALKNKKLMTLGDSLTEQGYWQNYMCGRLGAKDYLNLAIGGKRVFEFIENVNSDNIKDIDLVTIMGFFNNGSNIAGNIEDIKSNEPTSSVCSQYKYVIEYLYSLKQDIRIILLTPHRPKANDVIDKVEIVKQVGELYGIPVIDVYNNAGFNNMTYDLYLADDVHSNINGYKKEAEYIASQVNSIFI